MTESTLKQLLQDWLADQCQVQVLIDSFRVYYRDSGLPEPFGNALEGVLQRLESSSLFTEESCSFSKQDLVNALAFWLEKAQAKLA
jgi:hypothetical protein